MWIQSRTPSPSGCAETASSKSRAVAGSTVKVSSAVRSRRSGRSARRGRRGLARLGLDRGIEAALVQALAQIRAATTSRALGRVAELDDHAGAVAPALDEHHLAAAHTHGPAGEPDLLGAALEERLGDEEAPALADDGDEAADVGRRGGSSCSASSSSPTTVERALERLVVWVVFGSSSTRTSGLTPTPASELAVRGEVLARS